MWSLRRLERIQKIYSNAFRICIFLFSRSYSFGIETTNTFIHSLSSIENHTRFQTKVGKSIPYPYSDQNGPKSIPFVAAQIYMTYIREYHPPPPPTAPRAERGEPERHTWSTVKPHFTGTRFIQTHQWHRYYRQFVLSLGKKSPYIFPKFNPLNMDTFDVPLSVRINEVWLYHSF